jgi:hypothetical protein
MKMETAGSSETTISKYETARRHIPEGPNITEAMSISYLITLLLKMEATIPSEAMKPVYCCQHV